MTSIIFCISSSFYTDVIFFIIAYTMAKLCFHFIKSTIVTIERVWTIVKLIQNTHFTHVVFSFDKKKNLKSTKVFLLILPLNSKPFFFLSHHNTIIALKNTYTLNILTLISRKKTLMTEILLRALIIVLFLSIFYVNQGMKIIANIYKKIFWLYLGSAQLLCWECNPCPDPFDNSSSLVSVGVCTVAQTVCVVSLLILNFLSLKI